MKKISSKINKLLKKETRILTPIEQLNMIKFKQGDIDIVIAKDVNIENMSLKKLTKCNIFYLKEGYENSINEYTFQNIFKNRAYIYLYNKIASTHKNAININCKCNLQQEINDKISKIEGLKLFSNYNAVNNISVKTSTFFDFYGKNYYSGGAERYLLDLHKVCEKLGYNLNIYQHANIPFFRKYNNINVIGLCQEDENVNSGYFYLDKQTKNYIYHTYNNTNLHIYSAFQECYPNHIGPSIGISHGISWDSPVNHYSYGKDFFWENKKNYLDSAYYCDKLISVDTNTANWFQTIDYNLGNNKFHVIPNYVNTKEFKKEKNLKKDKEKIIITYPRRLYEPRGLYIVLDIVDDILTKYPNVEFHFVGKGFDEDIKNIDKKIKKWPGKIKCYNKSPQEMYTVYQQSDISLIPTLYSEGTSLSCLEALSSENIVIATRIGGLQDIIIDGFNGYLIEPSSKSLKIKLNEILSNFDKQNLIIENSRKSAKAFNKEKWEEKWINEIKEFDIKEKSKNNDLIEIYLKNINSISRKMINIIKSELQNGNLIYLRFEEQLTEDNLTHGLLQVVDFNEEIVNVAKKVYVDKQITVKVMRDEKIILF